jgi:3,4-dihydroxy 2-butanone 4-phosphate synthase/GTP cyclohydrolase II
MTVHDASAVTDELAAGRPALLLDDTQGVGTGSLVFPAECATAELVAFTVRHTSGFLSVALPAERADALELPPLVDFTDRTTVAGVSCDAREGTTTGISAADRARTIRVLANPVSGPRDLTRPGHIVPLRSKAATVLQRPDVATAALELLRAAGREPAVAISELVSMTAPVESADRAETLRFAAEHGLCVSTVSEIVRNALRSSPLVRRSGVAYHEVSGTDTQISVVEYVPLAPGRACSAVIAGSPEAGSVVFVNVVAEHFSTGLARTLTGRGPSMTDRALDEVTAVGCGVVVYFGSPGLDAAGGPELGERDVAVAAAVLRDLEVDTVRTGRHNEVDPDRLAYFGVRVAGAGSAQAEAHA